MVGSVSEADGDGGRGQVGQRRVAGRARRRDHELIVRAGANFARRQWRLLASMTATEAVVVSGLAWAMPSSIERGFVIGAGTVASIVAFAVLVTQATGTAHLTHGASADLPR